MSRVDTQARGIRWLTISGALALAFCLAASVNQVQGDPAADTRIKEQILARLTGLVSIHPERLEVEVNEGTVKLTGSVASLGEKVVVERIAGSITGVRGITNELTIRALDRPESQIAQEVSRLLQSRPKFSDDAIQVSVTGTEVTLDGNVKHAADRLEAEEIAGTAQGVTTIVNKLQVESEGTIPDETIRSNVASALGNPVSFGVIRNLEIEVKEGTVTLKGSVRRESDRRQAERLALGVEGVATVRNQLTVDVS